MTSEAVQPMVSLTGQPACALGRMPRVLVAIESSRASGRALLRGIAHYARQFGPWTLYWEPGGLEKSWPRLAQREVDGLILRDARFARELAGSHLPAVLACHHHEEIPELVNVDADSLAIGRLAADHLLDLGLRHFGYCGLPGERWSFQRQESFRQRLGAAGFELDIYQSLPSVATEEWLAELRHLAAWLHALPKPVGIMACNDDRGQAVLEACKWARLRVPEEVAVMGADNDEWLCELTNPPMTSVAINFEQGDFEGARALDLLMRGQSLRTQVIVAPALRVMVRQSTNLLRISDAQMAKALKFIRENAAKMIGVDEVALAAGLSRRVLEKRFRAVLSRSVASEIRRVKTAEICRLLTETGQPVSQIALALGFETPEHIARYFRRERGLTPQVFRQKHGAGGSPLAAAREVSMEVN